MRGMRAARNAGLARGRRGAAGAAAVYAAVLGCAVAQAESWTNVAGRAIEAQFVECVGRTVVLRQPDGSRLTVPLASLCAANRRRVAALGGGASVDGIRRPSPRTPAGDAERRAHALHAAGRLSDGELARVLQALPAGGGDAPRAPAPSTAKP